MLLSFEVLSLKHFGLLSAAVFSGGATGKCLHSNHIAILVSSSQNTLAGWCYIAYLHLVSDVITQRRSFLPVPTLIHLTAAILLVVVAAPLPPFTPSPCCPQIRWWLQIKIWLPPPRYDKVASHPEPELVSPLLLIFLPPHCQRRGRRRGACHGDGKVGGRLPRRRGRGAGRLVKLETWRRSVL